jgi:DNA-binding NarL/FixJ family response regulator
MQMELQDKARQILEAITKGQSYDQILAANPALTYPDIFAAAAEALSLLSSAQSAKTYEERLKEIHRKHPRAYSPWEPDEDEALRRLHASGKKVKEISDLLYRQPSAI